MTETGNLFLGLIRFALWGEKSAVPEALDADTVEDFLYEAKNQTVLGLMADALCRCGTAIPQEQAFKLFGTIAKLASKNERLNAEIAEFAKLQLPDYAIVKGQTIAALYPNPSLRMPGDVDFFVRDYSSARQILQNQWQIQLPERLIEKEFAFDHGCASYEIHSSLIDMGSRRHQRYWDQLMMRPFATVTIDGTPVPTLEPTLYAVYVFIHLFFHFIREGIGLRHLCDWAVLLHHYREQIDKNELEDMLKNLGFLRAYKAFGAILIDYLGLDWFPLEISEKDRSWTEKVLPDILYGGNFGNGTKKWHSSALGTKFQTFRRTLRATCAYLPLAPVELGLIIPKLLKTNIKFLVGK